MIDADGKSDEGQKSKLAGRIEMGLCASTITSRPPRRRFTSEHIEILVKICRYHCGGSREKLRVSGSIMRGGDENCPSNGRAKQRYGGGLSGGSVGLRRWRIAIRWIIDSFLRTNAISIHHSSNFRLFNGINRNAATYRYCFQASQATCNKQANQSSKQCRPMIMQSHHD